MQDLAELFAVDLPLPAYDVVIPCHNRAHVVRDAVESVIAQDMAPARIVVIDDGSTDDSAAVIEAIAADYPDLVQVAILPRNGGASNARNVGAALCRSAWIAFLDSDDIWLPGAARALLGARAEADVVCGFFSRVEDDGVPGEPECGWWGDDIQRALRHGGVIGPSWSIVRRAAMVGVRGFDPSFHNCNDWDFFTRIAAAGGVFKRVEATIAQYRTVAGSRLVGDRPMIEANARRVLSHPYLAELVDG